MTTARRLAAILAADVVGYSRLMGADEEGTLARLVALRQAIIDPAVGKSGGRIVKTTGDGFLIEFPSAVEAVRCALEIQEQTREHEKERSPDQKFQLRIGINVGDVIASDDDIHGDGVNVAARLEALAEPGGILVSATVHATAANRLPCSFDDIGERTLKNIEKPVRVYRVVQASPEPERPALALPDKPSLAVLPFQNMSGDPEQEYFADGMAEDITTALSRISGLFVIARNSAFTYKGRSVDVRQVGRELGVRYVLEGSVRKASNRVRITCQLVNASTGAHVWADRFDSSLDDIFELQDRVTESVAAAIEPTLRVSEIERALDKTTNRLDAYDLLLRARFHLDQNRKTDGETALRLVREAIALDSRFAQARAAAAWCIAWGTNSGWWSLGSDLAAEGIAFARAALATNTNDPIVLAESGLALGYLARDNVAGRAALDRALALNPNSAQAVTISAWLRLYAGDWRRAYDEFIRALRLSPRDHYLRLMLVGQGLAMVELGEAEAAIDVIRRGIAVGHGEAYGHSAMIHCLITLGRVEEARAVAQLILADNPGFTVTRAREEMAMHESSYRERRLASLSAAGLPE